jgi:peroxiredoxin
MQRLSAELAPRGLSVVAVSVDKAAQEGRVRELVRDLGLTFDVLQDESGTVLAAYGTLGVPSTFLIGRDGVIRRRALSGVDWDDESHRATVTELLAEPPRRRQAPRGGGDYR